MFNTVNANLYHYAGNNPTKYTDPGGRVLKVEGNVFFKIKVVSKLKKICPSARINILTGKIYIREKFNTIGHKNGTELIANLVKSNNTHTIRKTTGVNSAKSNNYSYSAGNGSSSYVNFNPKNLQGGHDSTGSRIRPAHIGLAHELGYSEAFDNGSQNFDRGTKARDMIPPCEEKSIKRENEVRDENNQNSRSSYY